MGQNSYTYDSATLLKDAGAVTADAAGTVGGSAQILDVGQARLNGHAVIDVSAIDITTGDEGYTLKMQGSSSSTFASDVVQLAALQLGDSTVTGNSADTTTGRFELPFTNEQDGVIYRYVRIYTDVAGTTPSINYTARLVKSPA